MAEKEAGPRIKSGVTGRGGFAARRRAVLPAAGLVGLCCDKPLSNRRPVEFGFGYVVPALGLVGERYLASTACAALFVTVTALSWPLYRRALPLRP